MHYSADGLCLTSIVNNDEIKSFASCEIVFQIGGLKLKAPFLIAAMISLSELPLNGGIPDKII